MSKDTSGLQKTTASRLFPHCGKSDTKVTSKTTVKHLNIATKKGGLCYIFFSILFLSSNIQHYNSHYLVKQMQTQPEVSAA